ncbi:hypothetical protein S40288_11337 [Stachybotrys chartarum IBT 40288]|nr:hypothetical protein S40288_11337 [Stachybotrys chartarum IBT 40288]
MPKGPCLFHEYDGFRGCFALSQHIPEGHSILGYRRVPSPGVADDAGIGAMPRIGMNASPTPSQVQRADAANKTMAELRKLVAKRKVNDALNARNGPSIEGLLPRSLTLGSKVVVFQEKDKWTGPYRILAVTDTAVIVDMVNGATELRSTHIKPYERFIEHPNDDPTPPDPEAETPEPFFYPDPLSYDNGVDHEKQRKHRTPSWEIAYRLKPSLSPNASS